MTDEPNAAMAQIAENLARVRGRIADAAERAGRTAQQVTLVGVTKYATIAQTRALAQAGCLDLGESRPQELWNKAAAVGRPDVRWHMIGHLQRNKVARTVPLVWLIHSADSLRLIQAIDAAARDRATSAVPILLEVNISGDATKHGFAPDNVEPLLDPLAELTHIDVRGLMAMAGREGDLLQARREFAEMRSLRQHLRTAWSGRFALPELSMGMSGDYEVAVEEGATLVRVGSALFEGTPP